MTHNMNTLEQRIIQCTGCSRLREHCLNIAKVKKKMFSDWEYWGKPVPNFGDESARLVIVGLAPAAHGANRTGRMFTGDQSGVWLYRALHKAGFASQPESLQRNDGLELFDCLVTAVCHCAPPDNKPTPDEVQNCRPFLEETLQNASAKKVVLALGQIAWKNAWTVLEKQGLAQKSERIDFGHGCGTMLSSGIFLLASYHPSQQNTFTGKLDEKAFDEIFSRCRSLIDSH
ncbi:MAG: uracil-DNA glycosylase [Silvanigrellaceae bacterium]